MLEHREEGKGWEGKGDESYVGRGGRREMRWRGKDWDNISRWSKSGRRKELGDTERAVLVERGDEKRRENRRAEGEK